MDLSVLPLAKTVGVTRTTNWRRDPRCCSSYGCQGWPPGRPDSPAAETLRSRLKEAALNAFLDRYEAAVHRANCAFRLFNVMDVLILLTDRRAITRCSGPTC